MMLWTWKKKENSKLSASSRTKSFNYNNPFGLSTSRTSYTMWIISDYRFTVFKCKQKLPLFPLPSKKIELNNWIKAYKLGCFALQNRRAKVCFREKMNVIDSFAKPEKKSNKFKISFSGRKLFCNNCLKYEHEHVTELLGIWSLRQFE